MAQLREKVLYDDRCPMCTFQSNVLTWLDWRGRLEMTPISSGEAAAIAPQLSRQDLLEAIHVVTPGGRIHRGARAIRYIGARLPLLWPLAAFLWIPGVIWIAEGIYKLVSANRHLLSRLFGCKTACTLLPPRPTEPVEKTNSEQAS